MKEFDMDAVKTVRGFSNPDPGGYICEIVNVWDVPGKQYLELELDIVEGEYTGFYKELYDRAGFWGLKLYRSYKDKAQGLFKGFIEDVKDSNNGFVWGWNESVLKGMQIGVILGEEEYLGNDGELKIRVKVTNTKAVDKIRNGKFRTPQLKKLESQNKGNDVVNNAVPAGFEAVNDEDMPFA